MKDWSSYFKGKKITVMGLGLLGRGVGDAEFLAKNGAELIVTDLKTEEQLEESLERLKPYGNIMYRLGAHNLSDFKDRDFILKSADVKPGSPYVAEARKNGIPVKMSASWFAELAGSTPSTLLGTGSLTTSGIKTIGVTGTRGKTTVTYMLQEILNAAGVHVLLGGNVRGVSTLALLDEITPESVALMELDSWQLQGWGDTKMSPNVSVFTTFYHDHLNYYNNDLDAYLDDKAQIFLHQRVGDVFILGEQAREVVLGAYTSPVTPLIVTGQEVEGWSTQLLGEHNRYNAALAAAAARAMGVGEEECRRALSGFKGVPGRLEKVGEVQGILFYNDTTATTPEATIAALRALDIGHRMTNMTNTDDKKIILIIGGADKGLDMSELLQEIPKHTKQVILLAGSGTDRIKNQLEKCIIYDTLSAAVHSAIKSARPGDTILLSPAFASFGMFKNEYDRGDQFNALVKAKAQVIK